ncbi:MAG: hypothetical protein HFJ50_09445 [Clostridia bacterium]|jgi:hypothetical protein|nr:hypothetical protein [Clostridia bacterium]
MILGIKYMMGSLEQRATYKKSMLPLLIGAVLLFSAVNLTAFIAENFGLDDGEYTPNMNYDTGGTRAEIFIKNNSENIEKIRQEYDDARDNLRMLEMTADVSEDELGYWRAYANKLYSHLQSVK